MSEAKLRHHEAKAAREADDKYQARRQANKSAMLFDAWWDDQKQVWSAAAIALHQFTIEAHTLEELIEKMDEVVPEYLDRIAGHEVARPICVELLFTLGPQR